MTAATHGEVIPFTIGDGRTGNVLHVVRARTPDADAQVPAKGPVLLVHGAGVRGNIFRAAVLVNENLDAASLQFYRQSPGSAAVPVQFLPPPAGQQPSAWVSELASRIDPAAAPWATLSESAAKLVAQRHRLQAATTAMAT